MGESTLDEKVMAHGLQAGHSAYEYHTLFENLPQPAWVFDSETLQILEVNRAAILQYGYSRQEFLTITIERIVPPEDIPRLRQALLAARAEESESEISTWRHQAGNRNIFDFEVATQRTAGQRSWR